MKGRKWCKCIKYTHELTNFLHRESLQLELELKVKQQLKST